MKKIIASLIAGLFATAAFAQTPAPAIKSGPMTDAPAAKVEADKAKTTTTKKTKAKAKHKAAAHKADTTKAAAKPMTDAPAK